MANDRAETYSAFKTAVNMAPAVLDRWLKTDESRSVGIAEGEPKSKPSGAESVGHHSGRRIVEIRRKKKADLTEDDYAHMAKVAAYVKRHLAQGPPKHDAEHSRWRYSLMNWGHDPKKG